MGDAPDKDVPRNPHMKRMNPLTWQPPMKQIEDALAGNIDIDAPVTFVSRPTKDEGQKR